MRTPKRNRLTVEPAIPKLRSGSYFPHWLLERRRRAEQALISVVATAYLLGVSTRRAEKLAESLGVTQLSKSQSSAMPKHLGEQVAAFRDRPPDAGPYAFVWVNALTECRVGLTQPCRGQRRGLWDPLWHAALRDPDAGAVNFEEYALKWVKERGVAPLTEELYERLLRLHVLPTFEEYDLDEITPPRVREWRTERLATTGAATTVAKSYRLLKAILETATDDELIRRNPCRIRGAGKEVAEEREIATVPQVDALADAVGPRWRLMVYLGAYGPLRPEEQAELRRKDVDIDTMTIRIRKAAPELSTGERADGPTKSEAGKRHVVLSAFLRTELRRHLDWYAEKGPEGLLFVGEKGAPFRRSSFGRKWRRARAVVGMPDGFRFYDLRHTGHTLSTRSGATLKDTMVRAGQSTERAALIYQHSDRERQKEVASGLDTMVRAAREKDADQPEEGPGGAGVVRGA